MRLDDWIKEQPHGAIARLARATGLAFNTILYLRDGKRVPSYATARAISDATDGVVSLDDLFSPKPKRTRSSAPKRRPKARTRSSGGKRASSMRAAAAA